MKKYKKMVGTIKLNTSKIHTKLWHTKRGNKKRRVLVKRQECTKKEGLHERLVEQFKVNCSG